MQSSLAHVVPLPLYQEQQHHIFPSKSSLDWFVRRHREKLVADGALLLLTGRWHADVPKFDACVAQIGQQQATRATA